MSKHSDIGKKINETLESFDGIQKAEPAPYFFTRLKARLERDEKSIWETMGALMARPAVAFAGLFFILAINTYILFEKGTAAELSATNNVVQNTEEEYGIADASTTIAYDYENIEP